MITHAKLNIGMDRKVKSKQLVSRPKLLKQELRT